MRILVYGLLYSNYHRAVFRSLGSFAPKLARAASQLISNINRPQTGVNALGGALGGIVRVNRKCDIALNSLVFSPRAAVV